MKGRTENLKPMYPKRKRKKKKEKKGKKPQTDTIVNMLDAIHKQTYGEANEHENRNLDGE